MLTKREKLRKTVKRLRRSLRPSPHPARPVFIFGEMRSGTNMLAECFDNSADADVYHETDDDAFVDYELRDLAEIRQLIAHSNGSHAVFKPIADSNRAHEVLDGLPNARGIWIYRRYQDAVNSALERWREHNEYLRLIVEEPVRARWRARNLSADTLQLIGAQYRRRLSEESARAFIWYIRNRFYFDLALDRRPDVLLLNYESLVTNPRRDLHTAFTFAGLSFKDSFYQHISSSSIKKKEDPAIDPEIAELCDSLMHQFSIKFAAPALSIPATG